MSKSTTAPEPASQSLLITGAAGNIGRMLRPRLARPGRRLRLLDLQTLRPAAPGEGVEFVCGSVTDMTVMEAACEAVDVVIHLAGHSQETSWQQVLEVNINGTYTALEAARRQRVPRVILASSTHAAGYQPIPDDEASDHLYPRPDTNYGVGKVAAEAIGSLYADRYGIDVICIRLGVCFDSPGHPRMLGSWLSPNDCGRLFNACLTVPRPGFRTVWGVSANTRRNLSLGEAERLGYQPRDDSEELAAGLIAQHGEPADDEPALLYVGGDWFDPQFDTARIEHDGQASPE